MRQQIRIVILLAAVGVLCSCMSAALQTRAFFSEPNHLAQKKEIGGVPFVQQETAQCGPATLTMAFGFYQHEVSIQKITEKILNQKNQGTLPSDMIMAARHEGFMAVAIKGLPALFNELAAGHPVIIFENLGLRLWPQWHYAIITGYDLEKKTLLMHSGPDENKRESIAVFELSWALANYWGLVIVPPGKLAATGNEFDQVSAAVALENLGFLKEAEISYQAVLDRWPQNYVALLGLGQMAYSNKKIQTAVSYFQKAVVINPSSEVARTNLAIAKSQLRK